MKRTFVSVLVACCFWAAWPALAQPETAFTYQGELMSGGSPANGAHDMEFRLWNAAVGGAPVGAAVTRDDVPVSEGRFTVELDFGAAAFDNSGRWLEVEINGSTLNPRTPITRSPYAIQTRGIFVDDAGNVGIGAASPLDKLHVAADKATLRLEDTDVPGGYTLFYDAQPTQLRISKHNTLAGDDGIVLLDLNPKPADGAALAWVRLFRETNTTGSKGLRLHRGNNTTQVSAVISVDGQDSFFQAHGGNLGIGTTSPLYRLHVAGNGFLSANSQGSALYVENLTTTPTGRGISATTDAIAGSALHGEADSTTGNNYGVVGVSRSTTGTGVRGVAEAVSGANCGVEGRTSSSGGRGVYGRAIPLAGSAVAVYGQCDSAAGYDFYAGGVGINYGSGSSIRWKRNVRVIPDPLHMVARLRGVYFDWDAAHGGHHDVGMIAEEVGEVLPEIVSYEENGADARGMDYSKLTPLLVEAINALRDSKDAEIASLRAENESLRDRLQSVEHTVGLLVTSSQKEASR